MGGNTDILLDTSR